MRRSRLFILLFGTVMMISILFWLSWTKEGPSLSNYLETIELLEKQNDSLQLVNKGYEQRLNLLQNNRDSLKVALEQKDSDIKRLINRKYDKVLSISKYDNDELLEFFARVKTDSLHHSK